jgi:tetratricopeptide (TPR) repeat protein
MRRAARQDADPIRAKPPAATNGQPAVQSGVDGLVQALSDMINQTATPQPSQLPGAQRNAADVQASTAEYKKGRALLEAKDYARAIEHLKKSNSIAPSSAAYMDLGIAYSQLKQYPEAIEAYKQVIRMVPNNAEVHMRLATAYHGQGSDLL